MTIEPVRPATPLGYSLHDIYVIAKRSLFMLIDVDMSLRCAGVAFFAFLSIFPAMAAVVAVFGLVSDPANLTLRVPEIAGAMPTEVISVLDQQLNNFVERDTSLGVGLLISLLFALWTGSRGMNALIYAITKAHLERDERGFVASVMNSVFFTTGAFITLGMLILATAIVPIVANLWPFQETAETLILILRWPVIAAVLFAAVFILLKFAPYRRSPKAAWVMPGVLVSTSLWIVGSWALSAYVENFGRYDVTFGSIAAAAVLMLWLYFTAMVLVLGACLNAQLEWHTMKDTTIGPDRPMGEREAYVADTVPEGRGSEL